LFLLWLKITLSQSNKLWGPVLDGYQDQTHTGGPIMTPAKVNFKIYQGSTFREVFRWESSLKSYLPITNITKAAPPIITCTGTLPPVGWRAKVTGVAGMKEINSDEYRTVTEASAGTVVFNSINASGYTTYTSGGILEYNTPIDLANYTARLQVRPQTASSTTILTLTTENGGIVLDNTLKTITVLATATQTTSLNFTAAVYSLELVKNSEVSTFAVGNVSLVAEVTR